MIRIVVLLKLVPDIRHIPDDAWDRERGTLRRNRLSLIPNPMDDRALALALRVKAAHGGHVAALSMGPPQAAALCSRALAFGADDAVLITDPACAGSDTLATATVLSRAVTTLCPDPGDLLVIAGMQSPDGDTAQVPVQVAAMLDAAVYPYVTAATLGAAPNGGTPNDGALMEVVSIASAGALGARLRASDLPAVVTCTDLLPSIPFHTSLAGLGRAAKTRVRILTAADLGLAHEQVGLAGSATRVVSISVAESVRRDVEVLDWAGHVDHGRFTAALLERIAGTLSGERLMDAGGAAGANEAAAPSRVETGRNDPAAGKPPRGRADPSHAVWAVAGGAGAHQLGILDHARAIAEAMGCATVACRVEDTAASRSTSDAGARDDGGPGAAAFGTAGATDVLRIAGDGLSQPVALARALEQAVRRLAPRVLLLPASPEGRVAAPYLAALLGAGLTADCTSFVVGDFSRRKEGERRTYHEALYQKRPALGGNIEATIVSPRNIERGVPQMATVRPGPTVERPAGAVREHRFEVTIDAPGTRGAPPEGGPGTAGSAGAPGSAGARRVDIERCKVLVSVGRGVGGETGINELARPLAAALRDRFGVDVEISASRMVVDAGDLERDRQVGQTGKTVRPDIYFALGISGSVQHRAGMDGSAVIIAVNSDAEAPIRMISDVFVHGRVQDVVPELVRALRAGGGGR